jgi:hypothetical protein
VYNHRDNIHFILNIRNFMSNLVWSDIADGIGPAYAYRTNQLILANLAANYGRQGEKAFVTGTYAAYLSITFSGAPTIGGWVEAWWSSSNSITAGSDNDGGSGVLGVDAAYYTSGNLDKYKMQLEYLGNLPITADGPANTQKVKLGILSSTEPYGMPIIINKTTMPLSNGANMYFSLVPLI